MAGYVFLRLVPESMLIPRDGGFLAVVPGDGASADGRVQFQVSREDVFPAADGQGRRAEGFYNIRLPEGGPVGTFWVDDCGNTVAGVRTAEQLEAAWRRAMDGAVRASRRSLKSGKFDDMSRLGERIEAYLSDPGDRDAYDAYLRAFGMEAARRMKLAAGAEAPSGPWRRVRDIAPPVITGLSSGAVKILIPADPAARYPETGAMSPGVLVLPAGAAIREGDGTASIMLGDPEGWLPDYCVWMPGADGRLCVVPYPRTAWEIERLLPRAGALPDPIPSADRRREHDLMTIGTESERRRAKSDKALGIGWRPAFDDPYIPGYGD